VASKNLQLVPFHFTIPVELTTEIHLTNGFGKAMNPQAAEELSHAHKQMRAPRAVRQAACSTVEERRFSAA